ncbi:MAG: GNAT family N-acetyltransferase [Pseudomonadota bacterium]
MLEVRRGNMSDVPALIDIFWCGVHEGAAPKYGPAQRRAWLPARPTSEAYAARLAGQTIFIAERGGTPVGFMTVSQNGLLDFAYVLPAERGQGTADILLAMVENHARASDIGRLTTRASDMARPFLARWGWRVTGDATVMRNGIAIPSTHMAREFLDSRNPKHRERDAAIV